jgi:hypothetical protein
VWVVEYRCPNCCQNSGKAAADDTAQAHQEPPRELAELESSRTR